MGRLISRTTNFFFDLFMFFNDFRNTVWAACLSNLHATQNQRACKVKRGFSYHGRYLVGVLAGHHFFYALGAGGKLKIGYETSIGEQ